ncbi:MAG TPA: hypothetical protein VE913_12220 [Longimicrobium sp.]|nr:hypothetical protein [Longimicrobium sp.]
MIWRNSRMNLSTIVTRRDQPRSWLRDRAAVVCAALGFATMGIGSLLAFGEQPVRIVLAGGGILFACVAVMASSGAQVPRSTTWAVRAFAVLYAALYIYRAL